MCAGVLLACILVARPFAEAGFIDDFSYIWTSKVLAETGHLIYNGWGSMLLGWQAYLGALFIKLFGYSCTAVRSSVVLVSLFTAMLLHRLLVRLGTSAWNSCVVTLTLMLSNLALPLTVSFMSDIPSLMGVLLCAYGCVRMVQAGTERATLWWLAAAVLSNLAIGTTRQICWLGALVMVPGVAWAVRRRWSVLPAAAAWWVVSALFVEACLQWFKRQSYTPQEPLVVLHRQQLPEIPQVAMCGLVLLLPLLLPFLDAAGRERPEVRIGIPLLGAAVGLVVSLAPGTFFFAAVNALFPWPVGLPAWLQRVIAAVIFACLAGLLFQLWTKRNVFSQGERDSLKGTPPLTARQLWWLVMPYTVAYSFLLITRSVIWPRYLLSLLPIVCLAILWLHRIVFAGRRLPVASVALTAVFAILAVTDLHDAFARQRARVEAVSTYTRTGQPRTALDAGLDLDGWVQIQKTGYLNEGRLRVPVGAYRLRTPPTIPAACQSWFLILTPALDPHYALTEAANDCLALTALNPAPYTTWRSPHQHAVYIGKFRFFGTP